MSLLSKFSANSNSEPKQIFRQFAWNLAGTLAKNTAQNTRKSPKKKTSKNKTNSKIKRAGGK